MANHSLLIPKCPVLPKDSDEYRIFCRVCFLDFDKIATVPFRSETCGHSICKPCFEILRETQKNDMFCQVCRAASSPSKWYRNKNVVAELDKLRAHKKHNENSRSDHEQLIKQTTDLLRKYEELYGTQYELKYVIKGPKERTTQLLNDYLVSKNEDGTFIKDYQFDEVRIAILNLDHDNKLLFLYNELLKKEFWNLIEKCHNEE